MTIFYFILELLSCIVDEVYNLNTTVPNRSVGWARTCLECNKCSRSNLLLVLFFLFSSLIRLFILVAEPI